MTQELANEIFETDLGRQLTSIFSIPDGRAFLRYKEAKKYTNGIITEWFPDKTI